MPALRRSLMSAAGACALLAVSALAPAVQAGDAPPQNQAAAARPFAVEYYYKVKWGHFEEFMELYQRNHYPILQRLQKLGRIVRMSAAYPVNHAAESARWDLRFTIVWKDAATAHEDFDDSALIKELYPDQEKFRKEEQRRFELLLEHTDVPVSLDDLTKWK